MSSIILKCTLLLTLWACTVVNATPTTFRHCDLADIFFKNGFNQYQTRFSICYAQSKNYEAKVPVHYRYNDTSTAIFFYGIFPITTPFCNYPVTESVCGINCKYTNDYSIETEVLCMKHVFEGNLSDMVHAYMKDEEMKLSDCMRTIFDDCRFSGPGGQTVNGQPIFYG